MLNIFGGVSIPRASHCWLMLAWVAEWVSVGTWCAARWYLWLERSAVGASCWWFIFSTLGGVCLSGGIMIGGMFTLGKFGATLGGGPGSCFDGSVGASCCGWTVAC